VTFGLWAIVWLIMWIVASSSRKTISLTVDEYGQVLREEL
jgi:hypothetical protein